MQFLIPPSTLLFLLLHTNRIALLFQYLGRLPPHSPYIFDIKGAFKRPPFYRRLEAAK